MITKYLDLCVRVRLQFIDAVKTSVCCLQIVAQSGSQLCVWYNSDAPEQFTQLPIDGDIEAVLRDPTRTEVIVQVVHARAKRFETTTSNINKKKTFARARAFVGEQFAYRLRTRRDAHRVWHRA